MRDDPPKKEVFMAMVAAICWLAIILIAIFCSATVHGQSVTTAVCRVRNQLGNATNVGSGTLVDKTEDGREGLVLTCWHLFREGTGQVGVTFADGRSHRARVVALDQNADLAALAIGYPRGEPAGVIYSVESHKKLTACGFGQTGQYSCAVGTSAGERHSVGQTSLLINDAVRSGDSGGGVFDEQGRLVAVVWGERDGVTYASCGAPLRSFLGRVLGPRTQRVANCPSGVCPRPTIPPRATLPPNPGSERFVPGASDARFSELAAAIERLQKQKQDRGEYITRDELQSFESESHARHESLLQRIGKLAAGGSPEVGKAAGAAVAGLLGLSGPVGWAVLAAGTVGGWLVGRHMKRRLRGAGGRRRPFRHVSTDRAQSG